MDTNAGGGGGGGGIIHNNLTLLTIGNYNIVVGDGGLGGTNADGNDGENSSFSNAEFSMVAFGGGKGSRISTGGDGGSAGGGGNGGSSSPGGSTIQNSINGTGYGNNGGSSSATNCVSGGGGGAGTVGGDGGSGACGTGSLGGVGGNGTTFNITNGTDIYYGGGGAGINYDVVSEGGLGGGGDSEVSGLNGTGGGGGGGGGDAGVGGNGGSGIVIIRYLTISIDVNLNSPIDNSNITNQTIFFNGTFISTDGIDNVTLFIDDVGNETNSSGINDTDYLFTKIISDGVHTWNYESCNSNGCDNGTARTFTGDAKDTLPGAPPPRVRYATLRGAGAPQRIAAQSTV